MAHFTCIARQQRVCFHYPVSISMGSAVRNTLGQGRASPCPARRVLGAHAAGLVAQPSGEPRGRQRQDRGGCSCWAPAESLELTGEEKKSF